MGRRCGETRTPAAQRSNAAAEEKTRTQRSAELAAAEGEWDAGRWPRASGGRGVKEDGGNKAHAGEKRDDGASKDRAHPTEGRRRSLAPGASQVEERVMKERRQTDRARTQENERDKRRLLCGRHSAEEECLLLTCDG